MEINLHVNINKYKKLHFDLFLFAILLVAAFLRFYHLGFQSAWLDEVSTYIITDPQYSMKTMHEKIMLVEGTPHLFFLLVKFLCIIFGHTVYVCRFLSAVAGVASVYYIFLVAVRLFGKSAGYIAAILLAVSFFHIEYSQEARAYALMVFFVIFSYHRLLLFTDNRTYKNAVLLGIFIGLIPNAHVFGLLNSASIFLTLLFVLLAEKDASEKKKLLIKIAISGIVSLIVFLPVIQIIERLSKTQTHWIPAATLDGIKSVFIDLLGKSEIMCVIFIALALAGFVWLGAKLQKKSQDSERKNNLKLGVLILAIWFVLNIAVIIIKSYTGDASLILSRYFIGVLPAFILLAAFVLSSLRSKILRYGTVAFLAGFSLYNIVAVRNYYNTIAKAQYDKLTAEIIKENPNNDKIVSSYGWVFNYYFDKSTSTNIVPATFHDYINSMKIDAVSKKSFWYFDGNSRPIDLNVQEQQFLDEYFVMDRDLNMYFDTWARHYTSKTEKQTEEKPANANDIKIRLEDFNPHMQNDRGDLLMFENGTATSKEIELKQGRYEIFVGGYSMPDKPINGENGHVRIKLNGTDLTQFYLTENPKGSGTTAIYNSPRTQKVRIQIVFDNDVLIDNKDRNVVITGFSIKKK